MRFVSFLIVLAFVCQPVMFAQAIDRKANAAHVKTEIGKLLVRSNPKVEVVMRDLTEVKGKVVGLYFDSFALKLKEPKKPIVSITIGRRPPPKRPVFIKYEDVLQLEGKNVALSFVPDPKLSPYAAWDDVRSMGVGEIVHVETAEGKRFEGVFMNASPDSVSVMRGNTKTDLEKNSIARVYRVRGGGSSSLLSNAGKGRDITEEILPIDGRGRAHPAAQAIGAGIGALIYFLPKGTKRVLVYAK